MDLRGFKELVGVNQHKDADIAENCVVDIDPSACAHASELEFPSC